MALRITKGSRSPSLTGTLTVDGVAFDLTGSTVKLKMRAVGSATLKVDAAATVVSAPAGTVRYDWVSADLDTAGDYLAWWEVTVPGGKVQDHPEFLVDVQEHAQAGTYLCEVAEVREVLQKPTGDREQDTILESMIAAASTAIQSYCSREFTDQGTLTRRFHVSNRRVALMPYDLRAATTVTLNPEESSPVVLVAGTDYALGPQMLGGTYQQVILAASHSLDSTHQREFGHALLDIAGSWGMAAVPRDVREAAKITVALWARREVQSFSNTFVVDEGRLERPEALPSAVRGMLNRYRLRAVVV